MPEENLDAQDEKEPQPPLGGAHGSDSSSDLLNAAYDELRYIAKALKRSDGSATLNPTALVHEAWLKLSRSRGVQFQSLLHFKSVMAQAMRYVLTDEARKRGARKRGADEKLLYVTFGDFPDPVACGNQFLFLHDALDELKRMNPRQAMMVEYRFFGGFDIAELAAFLHVAESTIHRDWKVARAWLAAEIRRMKRLPPPN
jgi:RNA polymerase sigma factor (TIGR02999 family)